MSRQTGHSNSLIWKTKIVQKATCGSSTSSAFLEGSIKFITMSFNLSIGTCRVLKGVHLYAVHLNIHCNSLYSIHLYKQNNN